MGFDPSDPWSFDAFDPPKPHVAPPRPKTPKLVPEIDRLFQVQRNALRALHDLDEGDTVEGHHHRALQSLKRDVENTYRVIRSYLEKYAE